MNQYVLMTYYVKYLKEIRKVSDSTVKHYQQALRYISDFLVKQGKIKQSIYEIQNIDELGGIREYLYNNPAFTALDMRGHRMYSAGLNNYYRFATGKGFENIHQQIEIMDIEMPIANKQSKMVGIWKRSTIIKMQAIKSAGYECEINSNHTTFISKSTGHPYMEGHHVLPMKYQDKFNHSLDVYANVICLCPTCHRLLHYGISSEKMNVVNKIYYDRVGRLEVSGLKLTITEFRSLIV